MNEPRNKLGEFIQTHSRSIPASCLEKIEKVRRFLYPGRFVVYDNDAVFIVDNTIYVSTDVQTIRKLLTPESQATTSISNILEKMHWPSVGYGSLKEAGFDSVEEFVEALSK